VSNKPKKANRDKIPLTLVGGFFVSKKKKTKAENYSEVFPKANKASAEIWHANGDYVCEEVWSETALVYRYKFYRTDGLPIIPHGPKVLTFDHKSIVEQAFSRLAKSVANQNPDLKLIENDLCYDI